MTLMKLACAAALGAGTTLSPSSAGDLEVGIGLHQMDEQSVARVMDLGIRHVRHTLYWSHWEDLAYRRAFESSLRRALQAGLDPLVVVHQAPFGDFRSRTLVYQSFARFMEDRAAQFPEVPAWQLWNEMDVAFTDVFGAGHPEITLRERAHWYAAMLNLTYPAIKRGNPRALVVVGGIASGIQNGFLEGLYESGARYDVLAIHTYGFPLELAFNARGLAARRIMRSHQDERPLWNTEFGLESAVIPSHRSLTPAQIDAVHMEAWRTSIEGNAKKRVYDRIYGHVLTEGRDLGFDLVRPDGSERPAYHWLKSWARVH